MADTAAIQNGFKQQAPEYKHLGFFYNATLVLFSYIVAIYNLAKESSGALRPGLEKVEGSVKTIVGPVYTKYGPYGPHLLKYADDKVGEILKVVDEVVPPSVKTNSNKALDFVKSVPQGTSMLLEEVKTKGLTNTTQEYYTKYEPKVVHAVDSSWKAILMLPLAPQLVKVLLPSFVFLIFLYNATVAQLKQWGLPATSLLVTVDVQNVQKKVASDVDSALKSS
jgi:hypothetical protein